MCKHENNILTQVAIIALLTSLLLPSLSRARYLAKRSEASHYAVNEIGDRKAPFTKEEKETWYKLLGAKENEEPSRESIDKYLEDCKSRNAQFYEGKL